MKTTTVLLGALSLAGPALARPLSLNAGAPASNSEGERKLALFQDGGDDDDDHLVQQVLETARATTGSDFLTSLLESDECVSFVEGVSDGIAQLALEFDDDAIADFACSAAERQRVADFGTRIAEEIYYERGHITCEIAYEMKLTETPYMTIINSASGGFEACEGELAEELGRVRPALPSLRRALGASEGRSLQDIQPLVLLVVVQLLGGTPTSSS